MSEKIKANTQDTSYVFIPVKKSDVKHLWNDFLLTEKDLPMTQHSVEILRIILEALK